MRRLLALSLFALAALVALPAHSKPAPLPNDSDYQLEAPLTDPSGRRLTLAARRGTPQLVVMRYRVLADGEFDHTGVLMLLDADGRNVARSSKTSGTVEPQFMDRIHTALAAPASTLTAAPRKP